VNARRPNSFSRVPSTREILDHVGWPVATILDRLFPHVDGAAVDLLYAETLDVICAHVERGDGILFADVPETLARLAGSGFRLAIASNGRRRYIEAVLRRNRLAPYFTERITVESAGITDKGQVLRAYLARDALTPAHIVMVGDRSSDVDAAVAVGCHFIGCDYGHGYRSEIEGAGPVVAAFDQLPSAVAAIFAGARDYWR
jgi:phosphoglycolate phosphatase-like HAD superfamily hydrolase